MRIIAAIITDGVASPSEPLPSEALRIVFNGTDYLVYEDGDDLPPTAVVLPEIPQTVSMRQGREALIRRGHFATVNNYITSMAGIEGEIARNEWEMSQVIERNRPLTLAMAQLIELDANGMDELFIYASTL